MERLTKLAHQVVTSCLNIAKNENVWIQSWEHTLELASQIAIACQERGAHPFMTLNTEDYWMRSLLNAPKEHLEVLSTHQAAALEQTDVFIFMIGPPKPIDWASIPSEKRELANIWFLESNKWMNEWRRITKEHSVRTLGIELCMVTPARANSLGLDFEEWEKVMLAGCLADQLEISRNANRVTEIIQAAHEVSIDTPFGTSLMFRLCGREPIVGDSLVSEDDATRGIVKFLPSGFVEVAVDEASAEGRVVFDVPIPVRGAKRVEGLALEFGRGKVVKYSAETGVEAFEGYLHSGQGDLDKIGFCGLGLNPGLRYGFTQDDKVLGGVTIGIGGNEDKGGRNKTEGNSHWWASMSGATVRVDGRVVLEKGKLLLG